MGAGRQKTRAAAFLEALWTCRVSGPTPDLMHQNAHANEIPRGPLCTWQFEKHWPRLYPTPLLGKEDTRGPPSRGVCPWSFSSRLYFPENHFSPRPGGLHDSDSSSKPTPGLLFYHVRQHPKACPAGQLLCPPSPHPRVPTDPSLVPPEPFAKCLCPSPSTPCTYISSLNP